MKKFCFIYFLALAMCGNVAAQAPQFVGDVLGTHNLSPTGPSPVKGTSSAACLYCHAPHSGIGGATPLWAHTLSSQTYTLYSGTPGGNAGTQPTLGTSSVLCLSCHDGTVAVGQLVPYGNVTVTGSMSQQDILGVSLKNSHPFSLKKPLVDAPNLVATLATTGKTADLLNKVALVGGTVECTSCHEPHVQNLDPVSLMFLVRDGSSGQLCLACHESNNRTVNGKNNPLAQWATSIHAQSVNNVAGAAKLGNYTTVAQFACTSCHATHNAGGEAGLLRSPVPAAPPTMDASSATCMTCHNGGSNLQQPIANVYAEFAKVNAHPFPSGSNIHDPAEAAVLANNRHATCADCHNSHSTGQVLTFPPAPAIRGSQGAVTGVSATDGTTQVSPAANQYENCLRCHGSSPGKQSQQVYGYVPLRAVSAADPLNVIPEFSTTSTSSHPVTHGATSPWPQPSLLQFLLNVDGTNNMRSLGTTQADSIFCTDCHNSDDNREFGGSGPSGPHGSQWAHILERRYEFSQVGAGAAPGTPVQNTFPSPNLGAGTANPGPYALCGKCHNLTNILSDVSFRPAGTGKGGHFTHVSEQGLSCSTCHTAHGMGAAGGAITGERMVNFDLKVVGLNGTTPISYNHAANTCTLKCHGYYHNPSGTVTTTPGP